MNTTVGQITDKGLKRQANEDNLLALPGRGLYLVADGVGGRRGGQTASRTVAEVFEKVFNQPLAPSPPESQIEELRALVASTVDLCNQKIFTEADLNPELNGMATTLALAAIRGDRAIVAHVGDSRVYRCDPQGLIQLTEDHSEVNEAVRAGLMTAEQAENHPRRNVISRAIGADSEVEAEIIEIEVDESTTLLLCSDGITRHIRDEKLEQLLRSGNHPQAICQTMKHLCYNEGAEDNLTAIIVDFGSRSYIEDQTRPMRSMSADASGGAERPRKKIEVLLNDNAERAEDALPDLEPQADIEPEEDVADFSAEADPQPVHQAPQPTPPVVAQQAFQQAFQQAEPVPKEEPKIRERKISSNVDAQDGEQKVEMSKLMRLSVLIVTLLAGFVLGGLFGAPLSRVMNQSSGGASENQQRVLRYSPSNPDVADAYGLLLSGRNEESRKRLNEILTANPNSAEAHYCMGRVDYTEKKYEEAINHFKQAVTLNSELDEAWVFIAAAYLNISQPRNASDSLQKLITPSASPSPASSTSGSPAPASTAKPVG